MPPYTNDPAREAEELQKAKERLAHEESKDSAIKWLAIFGTIAVLVIGVWLAVQIVRVIPTAFSSLASLAESVYSPKPEPTLTLTGGLQAIRSGQTFNVSWDDLPSSGTYAFNYVCADGVSVDIEANGQTFKNVSCTTGIALPSGTTNLDLTIASEKARFLDVDYSISFTPDGADAAKLAANATVTVINASIPSDTDVASDEPDEGDETETAGNANVSSTGTTQAETPSTGTAPAPQPRIVTVMPQSDPNGYADLKATVVATGYLRGKTFVPASTVNADDRAAIQVEVKNIGTKTSDRFDLKLNLPNGDDYALRGEQALKPNERAVYTIEFDAEGEHGTESFDGRVESDHDRNSGNDDFDGSMRFEN